MTTTNIKKIINAIIENFKYEYDIAVDTELTGIIEYTFTHQFKPAKYKIRVDSYYNDIAFFIYDSNKKEFKSEYYIDTTLHKRLSFEIAIIIMDWFRMSEKSRFN